MKNFRCFLPTIFLMACSPSTDNQEKGHDGYKLVWADEFNERSEPDSANWSHEYGFVRNQELQWYQPDNASIREGLLIIEGRREKVLNTHYDSTSENWKRNRKYAGYTSSSINTREKHSFQYGIFEVRARIDTARGMWPAIWTLGTHPNRGWPSNGETDIMEFYLVDDQPAILANAAWADADRRPLWDSEKIRFSHFLKEDPKWPEKFHVWKMDWTEDYIRLYLDDELLNEIDLSKTINADGFNPFHQPHYLLLNLAIGSNGGAPSQTDFRGLYEIDYVRVYQLVGD